MLRKGKEAQRNSETQESKGGAERGVLPPVGGLHLNKQTQRNEMNECHIIKTRAYLSFFLTDRLLLLSSSVVLVNLLPFFGAPAPRLKEKRPYLCLVL